MALENQAVTLVFEKLGIDRCCGGTSCFRGPSLSKSGAERGFMAALGTRIERETGRPLTPIEIFNITSAREATQSRLLTLYICTGLAFMLLPGTFLGVWNLFAISAHRSTQTVSPAWVQAHGHAQIFGWIGTFIIGIGYYSLSKMGAIAPFAVSRGWLSWALWTAGVVLR